ncbi:hypothetical protein LCGC14_0459910 [marine sediment metagenome]|uniref:Uncharacterized protein n=1 Tax=marine sediment metagenome TaxID=412755 RepID=A0A0F9VP71_9ZZZZ
MIEWILRYKSKFYDISEKISTGLYLPDKKRLILGYLDGKVIIFEFDINSNTLNKIKEFKFEKIDAVRSVTRFMNNSLILITTLDAGCLKLYDVDNDLIIYDKIGEFDKYNRKFCSEWINDNSFLIGSTFGNLSYYTTNQELNNVNIDGHGSDAIFGLEYFDNNLIISGGFNGNIVLWGFKDGILKKKRSLTSTRETIQAIACNTSGDYFATLSKEGTIQIFKKYQENNSREDWILYLRYFSGSGMGAYLKFSDDSKKVYALTFNEIIILDIETTGIYRYAKSNCQFLYENGNEFLIFQKNGIYKIEIHEPNTTLYQSFEYAKLGVIGHTQTGKSTLCNAIIYDGFDPSLKSTEMRTVWDWDFELDKPLKVIFHDFGGQSSIIPAHLPHIIDSDIIIIVYNQSSPTTFNIAVNIRNRLFEDFGYRGNFIFVQTHGDERNRTIKFINKYNNDHPEEVISPITTKLSDERDKIIGIKLLKEKITEEIRNLKPKRQINTNETKAILNLVEDLQKQGVEKIGFNNFFIKIKNEIFDIKKKYLLYVLRSLSLQGRLELRKFREKEPLFRLNDENYIIYLNMRRIFEAKNEILEEAQSNDGLINWKQFLYNSDNSYLDYFNIAIEMLESDITCISHHNQKIFLDFIKNDLDDNDKDSMLSKQIIFSENSFLIEKEVPKEIVPKANKWIPLILDLNLIVENISNTGGIFYFQENNAYCYISISTPSDILEPFSKISIRIDGKSEEIKLNLIKNLKKIIENIFESDKGN